MENNNIIDMLDKLSGIGCAICFVWGIADYLTTGQNGFDGYSDETVPVYIMMFVLFMLLHGVAWVAKKVKK